MDRAGWLLLYVLLAAFRRCFEEEGGHHHLRCMYVRTCSFTGRWWWWDIASYVCIGMTMCTYVLSTATTTINTVHCEMRLDSDDAELRRD